MYKYITADKKNFKLLFNAQRNKKICFKNYFHNIIIIIIVYRNILISRYYYYNC